MAKKVTKKDMFGYLYEIVEGLDTVRTSDDSVEITKEDFLLFIEHEISLLNSKRSSSKKPTKTQVENEGFKSDILSTLKDADRAMTIREIVAATPSISDLTNQRVTHLLIALRKAGKVEREYVKKVPYFYLITE